jgi:hypothetical protein
MGDLRGALREIVAAEQPMTVRQVFYQAVTAGLVEKTEVAYRSTIARQLLAMRRSGEIPYSWIADGTRWMRKPSSYTGLAAFIERHQHAYRRDLWAESEDYLEVWCEKEALAGVLFDVTYEFDVPLMVSRGFASESYLYSAAAAIDGKVYAGGIDVVRNAVIYYFGDHDPSGLKVDAAIETGIRRILVSEFNWPEDGQPLEFERVAVTPDQIEAWSLPTRPTKIKGNAHAKGWDEDQESVELDAIAASDLRELVRESIEQHIDDEALARIRQIEAEEREQLRVFGQSLGTAGA